MSRMIKFILIATSSKDLWNYIFKTNRIVIIIPSKIKYYNRQEYLAHSLIKMNNIKDLMIIVIILLLKNIKTFLVTNKDQH